MIGQSEKKCISRTVLFVAQVLFQATAEYFKGISLADDTSLGGPKTGWQVKQW